MSTIYGINRSRLFIVDPVTGEWTLVAALTGLANDYMSAGLVYNTSNSVMYLTAIKAIPNNGFPNKLYTVNLMNGNLTFVTDISGSLSVSQTPIRGLAYDKSSNQCYAVNPWDGQGFDLNVTYILDFTNGQLSRVGTPPSENLLTHYALVYDDSTQNLYGLASQFTYGGNLFSVNKTTGVWTSIGPIVENGFARGMTYDPTTGIFYGSSFQVARQDTPYDKTFTINVTTGEWTELGNTVNASQPQAMAVVPMMICLHANTQVELADGNIKTISHILPGDLLVQADGQSTPVRRNIMSGHKTKFVRVPKHAFGDNSPSNDLMIQRGHPLLLEGQSVPCEALLGQCGIEEVQLDRPTAIFTLVTEAETFVRMNGVLVGTWSEQAYRILHE